MHREYDPARMGLDGVYSDHVDLMVDVYTDELGAPRPPAD